MAQEVVSIPRSDSQCPAPKAQSKTWASRDSPAGNENGEPYDVNMTHWLFRTDTGVTGLRLGRFTKDGASLSLGPPLN
jgi:hypothetical protein